MAAHRKKDSQAEILDAIGSDPQRIAEESGPAAKVLIAALDRAAHMQSSVIIKWVDWVRSRNPEDTPEQIQERLDKQFRNIATGSGLGAGAAAAVPGIGFFVGAATVGAESLLFLDVATVYALGSAHLRGADITEPERRKTLILISLIGSAGTAIVDAAIGKESPMAIVSRTSVTNLKATNKQLFNMALKQVSKRVKWAWLGKLLPMGVGAVIGSTANRKIANKVIGHVHSSLGPLPERFDSPAKTNVEEPRELTQRLRIRK